MTSRGWKGWLLGGEHQKCWQKWLNGVTTLPRFKVPQRYHVSGYHAIVIQLHILYGVSEVAYGGVAYMKFIFKSLEGNLVMLKEDNLSGNKWPFVPIIDLMPWKDGIVRAGKIRTKNRKQPTVKIYSLEGTINEVTQGRGRGVMQ